MKKGPSIWLDLGTWLLNRRWWLVTLTSLSVFFFEYLEYRPLQRGFSSHFFFEVTFYALILPASVGLALSGLAASRTELAWSSYYQNLKNNLVIQMNRAGSRNMLASVVLRFFQAVMPLTGAILYIYVEDAHRYETVLDWSPKEDGSYSGPISECNAQNCPCSNFEPGEEPMALQPCRDPKLIASSQTSPCFCIPFMFSDSPVIAIRLYFTRGSKPSPEQTRLLMQVAPEIASAFQRIELEHLMKTRDDNINAQERRIARDVHDTLGHSLAYLRLRLDQISMGFDQTQPQTLQQEVETLRDVAKEAYDQMRDVLITLSPNGDSDINNVLVTYADRISKRANFKLNIHQSGQPHSLPSVVRRHIFYIFREILTNIEKHAYARQVEVSLKWKNGFFEVAVNDDGVGYEPALLISEGHFGLNNMRERALESNAQLSITSQPSAGTHIVLQVPCTEER